MTFSFEADYVEAYLKADRQWPHRLRVAHAKTQFEKSTSAIDRKFWAAVLRANDKGKMQ